MMAKRGKYDTNPLDEKVADRAEQAWGSGTSGESEVSEITREIRRAPITQARPEEEAPTRRIDGRGMTAYPSVFIPPNYQPPATYQAPPIPPANIYQPPPVPTGVTTGDRPVSGLGIPEKWAVILPYLPFYLAIIAAIGELLLVPRTESRVRFHAAQGLALQIIITAITWLLPLLGLFGNRFTGAGLFSAASTIFLIVAMVRVWKGNAFHIAPLEEATKFLDERIRPRK